MQNEFNHTFDEYSILEQLGETHHSTVYRAADGGSTVILKVMNAQDPSAEQIARFKRENTLVCNLNLKGVVQPLDCFENDGLPVLVLEDFGGVTLKKTFENGISVERFLQLAIRLADILGGIHQQNVTHRDIKPSNILWNPESDEVKITDFGISADCARIDNNNKISNSAAVEGTLAYISPEQTGRLNCGVDYRTDLYSLGVTFYEMLTGRVPFPGKEPMEIIHAHIALNPAPPTKDNPWIPGPVSDIVMKLLAKSPTERYQNAFGLVADLQLCLDQWHRTGHIESFVLGAQDMSPRFILPPQLVGRDEAIEALYATFERVSRGAAEFAIVTGEPGIGKSALVNTLHKPLMEKRGYFISGKFDQFHRLEPYSAFADALQSLIDQLLAENDERLGQWKQRLLSALGPNGKIITDLIPQAELILGQQPEIPLSGPEETQNRFHLCLKSFLRTAADEQHPLILFLDNLQWADSASLNLIQTIATDHGMRHLLLVATYRDNELAAHDLLPATLEVIAAGGIPMHTIHLGPIAPEQINQLIGAFSSSPAGDAPALAKAIHAKTKGNPFYIHQFLKTLYEKQLLSIDPTGRWVWDTKKIQDIKATENVVEFMADKLHDLRPAALDLLQIGACMGNMFDLDTLTTILERPIEEVLSIVDALLLDELIVHTGGAYQFYHDRIREAAYSLIPQAERQKKHYRIGMFYWKRTTDQQLSSYIFQICDQLNQADARIFAPAEQIELARLNLKAGLRAKASAAYEAALRYFAKGCWLLPQKAWQSDYDLTFALYTGQMECQYLIRKFEKAEGLFNLVIRKALTKKDKAHAYSIMTVLYTTMRSPEEAVTFGLKALELYGTRISINVGAASVLKELILLKRRLADIGIDNLENLPFISDGDHDVYDRLLFVTLMPAYFVNQNLFAKLILKGLNKKFKHNVRARFDGISYCLLATIIQSALGDYELGFRLASQAIHLDERNESTLTSGLTYHTFAFFIQHWKLHARHNITFFQRSYQISMDSGNISNAGHSINAATDCRIMIGHQLDKILEENNKFTDLMDIIKDPFIAARHRENKQFILNLQGKTDGLLSLSGPGYDEKSYLQKLRAEKNLFGLCYTLLYKTKLYYLYGKFTDALETTVELDGIINVQLGTMLVAEHCFYYSLTLTALLLAGERKGRKYSAAIRRNQRKMRKWAARCPDNFQHRYDIVAAESLAVRGQYKKALKRFHAAIDGARQNGYLHEEALANERIASCYLMEGLDVEAGTFLNKACQCYASWGATAKVNDLTKRHPQLVQHQPTVAADTFTGTTSSGSAFTNLDFSTVMKVSQIISREINLERLLKKTMHLSIANAGAQRGYLILESEGRPVIQASEDTGKDRQQVLQAQPLDACDGLSAAIVHYVRHSNEHMILGNALHEGPFTNDPHVREQECRSILCMPVMYKGTRSGVLYMENNLTVGAFTPERIEILRVITAQAAISIHNAQLYEDISAQITIRKRMEKDLIKSYQNVQNARMATILGLAKLAEYRDEETGDHLERMREYVRVIARELATKPAYKGYITPEYIDDIYQSAILHDIGKVGVPDAILRKPGKLTPEEFEVIKTHSTLGGNALRDVEAKIPSQTFLTLSKEIAYSHHEKWDGSGYPKGLKGEQIPLSARIVAIADVYDALTSKRVYKEAFSHQKAMEIIVKDRGTHFAPDIVDAFLANEDAFRRIKETMHEQSTAGASGIMCL